jgi:cytoskeleton protein RodZ
LLQLDPRPLRERFQQRAPTEAHPHSAASQQIVLPVGAGKRRFIYLGAAAVLAIAAPILVYEALHGRQEQAQPQGTAVAPPAASRSPVAGDAVPSDAAAQPARTPAEVQPLAVPPPVAAPVVPEASAPVPAAALPQGPQAAATAAKGRGLKLIFAGQSWVEIRDGRGKIVFSELNPGGSERQIDGVPPFSLVVGNATQVRIAYNGEPVDLAPHTRGDVAHLTLK